MSNVVLKINIDGVRQVLKSDGVKAQLQQKSNEICNRANESANLKTNKGIKTFYTAYVDEGQYTAIGKVVAATKYGKIDNARNNTLLKAR